MKTHSKTALAAAFLIASASAAMATDGPSTIEGWNYLRNPDAPVPQYITPSTAPAYAQVNGFRYRTHDARHAQPRGFSPFWHPRGVR